ncbi:YwiC-like family protein [Paenibacillus larvae]|uniref:YwiC-like family protein n=1 Tax=Paenibacillus larvae TaxID=1464 RepID=A0AAP5JSU5_9BACL|nr:YwiC-like family protein [Paenibacillus larvae]MDE5125078.1 YwiC-like family protein [Paenibacillus larvae subsp. larvae]MDE5140854.1 YwiC-like family protein [Paenibacillus larvae subsp. larvae]MDE5148714.1 YwiC-like family protein [Paenibacillus larvae subsp. larvae]MDE5159574.1 YwiC-like family protein [Paenibacillus larvae subsp. larvae]MDR5599035.1 YwiC-like family protein [Paenibacillus larvae]
MPTQHGAWAMLVIPFAFGMAASGPKIGHLLLFTAWLLVYLFSYPLLQWVRTGKKAIYKRPVLFYGCLLFPLAVWLLILYPQLVWTALFYGPLFLVNCFFASRNQERSLVNDLAAVLQFCSIVYVAFYTGGGYISGWGTVHELFMISLLYFIGTIFYVKTMIREKNNKTFYWLSVTYHTAAFVVILTWFPKWLIIPFAVCLLRAIMTPKTKITIKQVGLLEFAYAIVLTIFVVSLYH